MAIKRILIIGQTPPPYHGQAIMTKLLIESPLNNIIIYHIRLEFSKSLSEIGSLKIRKIIHLFNVLIKALVFKVSALSTASGHILPVFGSISTITGVAPE